PKHPPPAPIIDNLEHLDNPFRQKQFSSRAFLDGGGIAGADEDLEYALKFLYSYNGSSATFNAYRREIERLLQWAWRIERVSGVTLKRGQIGELVRFGMGPPADWIGIKTAPRFIDKDGARLPNKEWRPFTVSVPKTAFRAGMVVDRKRYNFSQAAVKAAFT